MGANSCIVWPSRGDASVIVKSIKTRLSSLAGKKILVFDKYHNVSVKDHERMRRAGLGSSNYDLTINTPLPSRDAIMRNKHNKLQLSKDLSTYSFGEGVTVESHSDGVFNHDEADKTMISYLLKAAESDTRVIRILSDDTDVFVLLVCGCKAAEKACGIERCSYHHGKISCTVYCACVCSDACFNPFKTGDEDQDEAEEEGEADVKNDEETEHLDHAFGSDDEWE